MVINRVHTSFIDFDSNGSKFKKKKSMLRNLIAQC